MSLAEFLAMGGYGRFLWPSYAVTLAVLLVNVWSARSSHRRALVEAFRRVKAADNKAA